jgi:PAS domain S-box-containing protein
VELAPDATVVADQDGRILLVNRRTEALFGYRRQDLLGQPVDLLIPERFRTAHRRHRAEFAHAPHTRPMGANLNVQLFGRRRDGTEFPVEVSLSPFEEGDQTLIVSSIRDLSARQQVEAARAAAEAANEGLRRLQALTDTALSHLALDDLVRELLDRIPAVMGVDTAAILLLDGDGQQLTVRAAHGLEEAVAAQVTVPLGQGVAGRIAATRTPLIVDDLSTFDVLSPYLPSRLRSLVGVPLLVEDRLVGVLHMGSATPRHFTEHDVQLLQRVGDRIALAVDRAQTHQAEQVARREAEAATEELRRLQALTDTALAHLGLDDLLRELLGRIGKVVAAEDVAIFLLDGDGQQLTLRAARGLADAVAAQATVPVGQGILGRVAASRTPVIVNDLSTVEVVYPQLREMQQAVVGVPLLVEDRLLGVVYVGSATARQFSEQDVELLQRAADRIALAIERARLFEAEQVARREAERERARWQAAMDSAPEFVITCDADLRRTYVNPAYAPLRGGPADPSVPAEEISARYGLYLPNGTDLFPAEQLPVARAVREGRPVHDIEMVLHGPDGEQRLVVWESAPMRSAEGELLGAVSIGRDITERKRLEQALRESEARYRDLVETQTELICRYLPDTTLTFINEAFCRYYGKPREELLGRKFLDLADESTYEHYLEYLAALLAHQHMSIDEHQVVRPDGSIGWQQWVDHAIYDAEGHLVEIQAVGRDITERKRAEEGLLESEARFRAAFESAATGMMLVDTTGHALQANRPLEEMLGYSEAELCTMTFADFTHPDDLEPNLTLLRQTLAGEIDSYQLEKRYVHKRGHVVWVLLSAGVVRDAAGQPLYLVGQVQDITERKRAEEALRESEERFRTMADTAPVLLWVAGPDGLVTFVNAPWLQFTGRRLEEEIGNGWAEGVHPEDYDRCLQAYRTAFQARERFTMEYRLKCFDGKYRWVVDTGVPRFAPDGTFLGYIGSAIDITERKHLEREHAEQAEQLDRIFEQMADGVTVWDAQGQLVRTNAALRRMMALGAAPHDYFQRAPQERMALYVPRDAEGQPLGAEDWPVSRALRGEVLTGPDAMDMHMRTFEGGDLVFTASAAPLRDQDGHIVGAVGILRDQTERNRLEREREAARASELALREVNRHMEEFLITASHELRTPITGVVMGVEVAQRRVKQLADAIPPPPPPPQGHRPGDQPDPMRAALATLERADAAAHRLSRLIVQLFDVAQARSGILDLKVDTCDLAALVSEQVAEQRALAPERSLRLELEAGTAVPVVGDSDRLGQVLANYLTNGLKYSPDDQPVEVSLRVEAGWVRVAVRDGGPGLPSEEQARVWELFHRAPGVAAQGSWGGSMGLGLYICQQIVELHGGEVGVESAVGQGSTFWFTLPLAPGGEAAGE